jgi:hypothetical protein
MIYDLIHHKVVEESRSGLSGFISFERLVEQLRVAREFHDDEVVTFFEIDKRGITFRLERK